MEKQYAKGELLRVLTVDEEVCEGRFYAITSDKSKISLYEPSQGIMHYYKSEIREISKVQETDKLTSDFSKHLKFTEKEYADILNVSKKYIFINQVDNTYYEALEDLNNYSYIAVGTDGAEMGRNCKLPFLTLSTPTQVYIFDIQVMQYHAFDGGLKKMLENKYPKKIIHDCRKLSDCLYHKHNVELKSVFDTQVGDTIISKNKTGQVTNQVKSLQDCMRFYLGLPASSIEDKLDLVECTKRPLSVEIKETLAKNIAYLHRLSEMINEELLLPFVRGVECYVDNIRSCDDFQAWSLCGKDKQLPKEFKNAIEY